MQPLVTISIPLFNCEDFIEKCLESVRQQTYNNFEVTLINDCTSDCSVSIAEEYIAKYHLQETWKIIHLSQNSGLSVVRNKGIDTASGKYLFFLDSDDTITPDCIETLVAISEKTGAQMTMSQLECEQQQTGEKNICIRIGTAYDLLEGNEQILNEFSKGNLVTYAVNKLFIVDYLREHKLYFVPGLFAQDELWTFHSVLKMDKIAVHKEVTYTYFLHSKSVIHNRNRKHFDNWATIIEHMYKALEKEPKSKMKYIKTHIINYKTMTLIMNWKAQESDEQWLYSYHKYYKTPNLSLVDYFSPDYSLETKKKSIKLSLPPSVALKRFKKVYYS